MPHVRACTPHPLIGSVRASLKSIFNCSNARHGPNEDVFTTNGPIKAFLAIH